jgi:hypothetical protein
MKMTNLLGNLLTLLNFDNMENYLTLYKKWCKTGRIQSSDRGGLCNSLIGDKIKEYFEAEGKFSTANAYWGYGDSEEKNTDLSSGLDNYAYKFTSLRQNMILLLAAINNEL